MKYLIALLLFTTTAQAQVTVRFENKCPDFSGDWACLNETQAAQKPEILSQVWRAVRHAKIKKPLVIYSVDPIRDSLGNYYFGAHIDNGKIYFRAMPGCPNARRDLERLLRKLK